MSNKDVGLWAGPTVPPGRKVCPVMSRAIGFVDKEGEHRTEFTVIPCVGSECAMWYAFYDEERNPAGVGNCSMGDLEVEPFQDPARD